MRVKKCLPRTQLTSITWDSELLLPRSPLLTVKYVMIDSFRCKLWVDLTCNIFPSLSWTFQEASVTGSWLGTRWSRGGLDLWWQFRFISSLLYGYERALQCIYLVIFYVAWDAKSEIGKWLSWGRSLLTDMGPTTTSIPTALGQRLAAKAHLISYISHSPSQT